MAWLFEGHKTRIPREPKVINDALLGNQYFAKHEILVIDSPLIQRLRRIRQTGLVYHVFPSATHTRFEHCLGACTVAERCFNAIKDRFSVEESSKTFPIDVSRISGDLAHLRMAALLHDVGHGFCSHASEQIYGTLTDIRGFKDDPKYVNNATGEILSYLMITAPAFKNWFEEYVRTKCHALIDLDVVADMILGKHKDNEKYFLAQIISSPYDADKLDYIARDSYYCGLALTVDLPRFYSMISTTEHLHYRILVLRNYVPLEQILFSKMMLFGSVYHHQKVKCVDSMLRSLVQHIINNPDQCAISVADRKISFTDPVDYLYVTDDEFFGQISGFGDDYVRKMLKRFRSRNLFLRCMEISRRTVKNWDDPERKQLIDLSDSPERLAGLEKEIHKRVGTLGVNCNSGEILLSVPSVPRMKSDFAYIQTSVDTEPETVEKFFPLEQWTDAYAYNKWKSFVYAPPECSEVVRDAAISVLEENLGVKIDRSKSDQACHLNAK
ncbi:MAG: HD domain-containing protein [Candidatus Acidiferrales bacterium]